MPELQERPCIILDGLRFDWTPAEMESAVEMWQQGATLRQMVDKLNPLRTSEGVGIADRTDEVRLLLLHLEREGMLIRTEAGLDDYRGLATVEAWNRYVADTGGRPGVWYLEFRNMLGGV